MNSGMILEVCVDSVQSALNAYQGGAHRIELCSSLCLGGLTPSLGLFQVVRKLIPPKCLIFTMIRPKPGEDYMYDEHELDVMVQDIEIFRQNGADGFVFGCLDNNKDVDERACLKLLKAAAGHPCTFHRAFDVAKNPEHSLSSIVKLGFNRILTSGQEKTALLGKNLIKELVLMVENFKSPLAIVAGGGVNPSNLKEILEATGVKEYHGSARRQVVSDPEKNIIWTTDESVVREMIEISKNFK